MWRPYSEVILTAWQAVQAVTVLVQVGVVSVPPIGPLARVITAPWHHVALQDPAAVPVPAVQVPRLRLALAAPLKPTSRTPFAWVVPYVATLAWHVWQSPAAERRAC